VSPERQPVRPRPSAPTSRPKNDRRLQLLNAAIAVIAERGVEGLRTREIAARAGANISTLHYYFRTKEALLLSVLGHVVETLASTLPDASCMCSSGDELRRHLLGALRDFRRNRDLATVLQELRLRSRRDPNARRAFRALHAQWNQSVAGILRRAIDCGTMRPDVNPEVSAVAITSLIMGLSTQLWINPKACDVATVSKELDNWLAPIH
jgi:AcrR family transcriptional regulator